MITFVGIQIWKQDTVSVPLRIIKKRSIAASAFYVLCIGGTTMVVVYYLPVWFQAIKRASAVKSGIMDLPFVQSLVGAIRAGIGVLY